MDDHHNFGSVPSPRPERTTVRVEPVPSTIRDDGDVRVRSSGPVERRDRVRWGPVWAGLVVTLSTFLLLELVFLALGWLSLAQGEADSTAGWTSGVIGLVAFFIGGLTAGATAMWRSVKDGLLQGVVMWALTTMGIIFLTLFGGGALFGSAADVLTQVASIQRTNVPDVDLDSAVRTARSATNWAVLGLVLSLVAAGLGGALGGRMWPAENDEDAGPSDAEAR